ncbi:MAG: AAA family ATPase [Myxococcales bacterium]|nr:AAA family ATPase [Myxococcales bacterium]
MARKSQTPSASAFRPYESDLDYLHDVLSRLKMTIALGAVPPIGETESELRSAAQQVFEKAWGLQTEMQPSLAQVEELRSLIERLGEQIDGRLAATRDAGLPLPHGEQFRARFALTIEELEIVYVLLGRQIDRSLRTVVGDFHSSYGAVKGWTLLKSLSGYDQARFELLLRKLGPDQTLIRWRILVANEREYDILRQDLGAGPEHQLFLSETVANFLLGRPHMSTALEHCSHFVPAGHDRTSQFMDEPVFRTLDRALTLYREKLADRVYSDFDGILRTGLAIYIAGQAGSGRRMLGQSIAGRLGRPAFIFDCASFLSDDQRSQLVFARLFRDARLLGGVVVIHGIDAWNDVAPHLTHQMLAWIDRFPGVAIISSVKPAHFDDQLPHKVPFRLKIDVPGTRARERVWGESIAENPGFFEEQVSAYALARYHPLYVPSIHRAVGEAIDRSLFSSNGSRITQRDLVQACRDQVNKRMAFIGTQVLSHPDWSTLVLEEATITVLREIVAYGRNKVAAYEDWGFAARIGLGRGVGCLFFGEPGTGKTMASGIIARELDRELYKVNVAQVMSKYIGETEKNLDKVFGEAQESNSIILFDEADALFGKRQSEVKSATDRYANLEVNYLLQKLEEFEGIVILTTNKKNLMDKAFMRRLQFRVYFPFPTDGDRARLWKSMLPKSADVRYPIEYEYLAVKYFRLAGGYIKNAVMRAAVQALEEKNPIDTIYLDQAAEKECRETGSLWKVEHTLEEYLGEELFEQFYGDRVVPAPPSYGADDSEAHEANS